jgi:hypothetical protein
VAGEPPRLLSALELCRLIPACSRFLRGRSVALPSGRGRPYLPSPGAGGWPKAGPRPLARATKDRAVKLLPNGMGAATERPRMGRLDEEKKL